jgi:hypothetical protein
MWGNDKYGCCTCATEATLLAGATHAATGTALIVTEAAVLWAYSAITGFRADDPTTDRGAEEPSVIDYMTRYGLDGHPIEAHAYVEPHNAELLKQAVWIFGGVAIDLALPLGIDAQTDAGQWWLSGEPVGDLAPGADGYHEAALMGVTADSYIVRTWGTRVSVSPEWFTAYCTGAWALRRREFLRASGLVAANGIDVKTWDEDLGRVGA